VVNRERKICKKQVKVDGDSCAYVADVVRGSTWLGGKETVGRGLVKLLL
jgi:CRISPR/Cas system CMR subunit Cmr4 (Cas7 group RAMP superfamily)